MSTLLTTNATYVQGAIRPGCTHMVLDILGPPDIRQQLDALIEAEADSQSERTNNQAGSSINSSGNGSDGSSGDEGCSGNQRYSLVDVLGAELLATLPAVIVQGHEKVGGLGWVWMHGGACMI